MSHCVTASWWFELLPKIQGPWILSSPLCCNKLISRTSSIICKEALMILAQSTPYIAKSWSADGREELNYTIYQHPSQNERHCNCGRMCKSWEDMYFLPCTSIHNFKLMYDPIRLIRVWWNMSSHVDYRCVPLSMRRLMRLTQHWLWAANSIHTLYTCIYTRLQSRSNGSYVVLSLDRWHPTGWQYRQYLKSSASPHIQAWCADTGLSDR